MTNQQHAQWKAQAYQHWRENNPQMVARLRKSGQLQTQLDQAVQSTASQMQTLREAGLSHQEAWEQARQTLFLPQEPSADEAMEPDEGAALYAETQRMLANLPMPGEKVQ